VSFCQRTTSSTSAASTTTACARSWTYSDASIGIGEVMRINKSPFVTEECEPVRFSGEEIERVLDELVTEGELKRFVNDAEQLHLERPATIYFCFSPAASL
jgi:hypothetical protein